jgi:hypothetical protein
VIVMVGYRPTVETHSEAALAFGTTTPPRPRAATVQMKGRTRQQVLSVDRESLDFGTVDVNAAAESKEVTVTNHSSQTQRLVAMLHVRATG